MLKTCQSFLPAEFFYPPVISHQSNSSLAGQTLVIIPKILHSLNSLQNRGSFFLPLFNTCKVDTYFQKTKIMLYEKM